MWIARGAIMPEEPDLARISTGSPVAVLSVSELNRSVRDLVEHRFALLRVRGEIANCTIARSGHVYFSLKDDKAQVRCVIFRNRAQLLGWNPCDGVAVEAQALPSFYEPRGEFQLVVETLSRGGTGALYEAFVRLKDKLEREGLFEASLKRPLPFLPRGIGIVTSLQAAALRDVLTTLARRNPSIPVFVYPTPVQGAAAPAGIVRALARAGARRECEVLLLCRGGGGIEDLWPFNEESVARAIRACPLPVVSGVGHETDFSIADFAADRRAPTPTAAAEMVSPPREELLAAARALALRLTHRTMRELEMRAQSVDRSSQRLAHPAQRLLDQALRVEHLSVRLSQDAARVLKERAWRVGSLARRSQALLPRPAELAALVRSHAQRLCAASVAVLERSSARVASLASNVALLSPAHVMERGYSVVRNAAGRIVADSASLQAGEGIEITFARGSAAARIESTRS
jgi:exodeoxyribonuclease VII large subunit